MIGVEGQGGGGAAAAFAKAKTWLSIAMGQQTHGIRDGDPFERYEFEFGVLLTDIIYMGVTESYVHQHVLKYCPLESMTTCRRTVQDPPEFQGSCSENWGTTS